MKVIYVMGAGHSGSTLLDIILSNHPNIVSVGELYKLHRSGFIRTDQRRCSCGLPIHECLYWCNVRDAWIEKVGTDDFAGYVKLQYRYEFLSSSWGRLLWNGQIPSPEFQGYMKKTAALYEAIQEISGKSVIVDSSKSPRRAYALALNPDIDLRLIHLVRDGRACAWSHLQPRKKNIAAGIPKNFPVTPTHRTTRNWISSNLQSEWVLKRQAKEFRQRVRYEDFTREPSAVLELIGTTVGENLNCLAQGLTANHPMEIGHSAGGNSVRMSQTITLKPDFKWMEKMSIEDRQSFWRMAGWMARHYEYEHNPEPN